MKMYTLDPLTHWLERLRTHRREKAREDPIVVARHANPGAENEKRELDLIELITAPAMTFLLGMQLQPSGG